MKVRRVYYSDDNILIPGHMITRLFHKTVFYPFEGGCGFSYKYISKKDQVVEFSQSAYRDFYKSTYPEGTRIRGIVMCNEPWPVPCGTEGTVVHVDDMAQIHCHFDNGRQLAVIPGVDAFQKI